MPSYFRNTEGPHKILMDKFSRNQSASCPGKLKFRKNSGWAFQSLPIGVNEILTCLQKFTWVSLFIPQGHSNFVLTSLGCVGCRTTSSICSFGCPLGSIPEIIQFRNFKIFNLREGNYLVQKRLWMIPGHGVSTDFSEVAGAFESVFGYPTEKIHFEPK